MRKMKETARGVWVVWDEPLPIGKSWSSGAVVYKYFTSGRYSCDAHGTVGGFPPIGSTVSPCDHIDFINTNNNGD